MRGPNAVGTTTSTVPFDRRSQSGWSKQATLSAFTWGGKDHQAIEDVASLGFPGIQLRSNILPEFGDKPAALKELLQAHDLKMVALSSGGVSVTTPPAEEFVKHERHAAFVRAVGGLYLQVTDQLPKGRPSTAADR